MIQLNPHTLKSSTLSLVIPFILLPTIFNSQAAISETVSKRVALDGIEHIQLLGTYNLTVKQGDEEYVLVTTDSEYLSKVQAKIQGRKLALGKVNIVYGWSTDDENEDINADFEVQVKNLRSISNMGVGKIAVNYVRSDDEISFSNMGAGRFSIQTLQADEIDFSNFGAGVIEARDIVVEELSEKSVGAGKSIYTEVTADEIEINTIGAARVTFNGRNSVDELEIDAGGATTVDAEALIARKAEVETDGSSTVRVTVTDELEVEINGVSKVFYSGEPKIDKSISDAGRLTAIAK